MSSRPVVFERVQSGRLGHAEHSFLSKIAATTSLPWRLSAGFHCLLFLPSGQVTLLASQSTRKARGEGVDAFAGPRLPAPVSGHRSEQLDAVAREAVEHFLGAHVA